MPLRSDPEKARAWQDRSRATALRKKSEQPRDFPTGEAHRSPQGLQRAGRLRARSPRKKDRYDAIAVACGEAIRRDGHCIAADPVPSVRCAGPLDPQHLWPRLVAPAQVANPDAVVACCRAHHCWIDANPEAANAVGLHAFTGDTLAELAQRRQSAPDRRLSDSGGSAGTTGPDGT